MSRRAFVLVTIGAVIVGLALFMLLSSLGGKDTSSSSAKSTVVRACGLNSSYDCACIVDQLERRGYDTDDDWAKILAALVRGQSVPEANADIASATAACPARRPAG
jgi:hypothetical protein